MTEFLINEVYSLIRLKYLFLTKFLFLNIIHGQSPSHINHRPTISHSRILFVKNMPFLVCPKRFRCCHFNSSSVDFSKLSYQEKPIPVKLEIIVFLSFINSFTLIIFYIHYIHFTIT